MHPPDPRAVPGPPSHPQDLLPRDAYPPEFDEEDRGRVDLRLRALQSQIPDQPGSYLDRAGDPWTAHADGSWADMHGERRGPSYTPLLGLFGPWRRVEGSDDTDQYEHAPEQKGTLS